MAKSKPKVLTWTDRQLTLKSPKKKPDDFQRDRARIIHSSGFRRLQGKTQTLGITEGDFHRTRLTHSLEVAQVGMGIVDYLNQHTKHAANSHLPSEALMTAISLAHDLGHPAFGHAGEQALDFAMRDFGGFEGNGQTLRQVARKESHTEGHGLNLTRRVLLGLLKYPAVYGSVCATRRSTTDSAMPEGWKPPKCYMQSEANLVDWILEPLGTERAKFCSLKNPPTKTKHGKTNFKSLDCSIMELADDIAYGVHDFEDGLALGLIRAEHFDLLASESGGYPRFISARWRNLVLGTNEVDRKQAIGRMVHIFITACEFKEFKQFTDPLIRFNIIMSKDARNAVTFLQELVKRHVIRLHAARTLEWRGQYMISRLFEAIESSPNTLLRSQDLHFYHLAKKDKDKSRRLPRAKRIICDYIAGMTDIYAARIYERLFIPRLGSVFERL